MSGQRNFQRELDAVIESIDSAHPPRLLLHGCCAPCSSYVLEYLSQYFEITLFYYNPNITSHDEYLHRTEEARRLVASLSCKHPITFSEGEWDTDRFLSAVKGLESEPEGGARCQLCFRLRLDRAARKARDGGYDFFTTTLSISPLKNATLLNEIGEEVGALYGVRHLPSDFKKRGGYQRSIQLSKEYDLYRQDFCGCAFSLAARRESKE